MGYGNDDGGQMHDGYPKKTSAKLAAKDKSAVTKGPLKSESQAKALVNLVLKGEDPHSLMNETISQISEGQGGGPYPIGAGVKVNKAATVEKVGGGTVSLSRGQVVYIVQPNLGETGTDKMVLLPDGSSRAVVPMDVLGESDMSMGPDGHAVTPAKAPVGASKPSVAQGQSEPKDDKSAQSKGSSSASSNPSMSVGAKAASDAPEAQSKGKSSADTLSGKAVESRKEVISHLDSMLEGLSPENYVRVNELRRQVEKVNSEGLNLIHQMLLGEKEYPFEQLETIASTYMESDCDSKDSKKYKKPFGGNKANMKTEKELPPEFIANMQKMKDKDSKDKKESRSSTLDVQGLLMKRTGAAEAESTNGVRRGHDVYEMGDDSKSKGMQPSKDHGKKDPPPVSAKPGKVKSAPGLKESTDLDLTKAFAKLDEDTNNTLGEGNGKQFQTV